MFRYFLVPSKLYTAYLLDIFYPMTLREDFTFFTRTRPVTQNRLRASSCLRSANAQPSHLLCFGVPALLFSASAPSDRSLRSWSSPRPISNSQLHALLHFHLCPIYLVVFKGSYFFRMGYLILRGASRLDAFSVYPVAVESFLDQHFGSCINAGGCLVKDQHWWQAQHEIGRASCRERV